MILPDSLVYVIRDWFRYFESAESKKIRGPLKWLPIPTKHDGKGYRRLLQKADGTALFGAWVLLLQVAAKCPVKGIIADEDGPLDSEDIAIKSSGDPEIIARMLEATQEVKIGWVVRCVYSEAVKIAGYHQSAGTPADTSGSQRIPADTSPTPDGIGPDESPGPSGPDPGAGVALGPLPVRAGPGPTSIFAKLTAEHLADEKQLRSWFEWQLQSPGGRVPAFATVEDWARCQDLAKRAAGKKNPPAWFAYQAGKRR